MPLGTLGTLPTMASTALRQPVPTSSPAPAATPAPAPAPVPYRAAAPAGAPMRDMNRNIHGAGREGAQVRDMSAFMSGGGGQMSAERAAALRADRWKAATVSNGISQSQSERDAIAKTAKAADDARRAKARAWNNRNNDRGGGRGNGPGGGGGGGGSGGGAGSGGGVSCFIAGTRVLRADGTLDAIENIEIGDELMGMDDSVNEVLAFDRPELWDRALWTMNDETTPWFTSEHPFYTTEGWKSLEPELTLKEMPDLDVTVMKAGDKIVQADGRSKTVEKFDFHAGEYDTQLYNFVLSNTRSYFANGNLVHNVK